MEISLGGVAVKSTVDVPQRFSLLLWGLAKSGKTTLASTAPGKILWINFDPDGLASLSGVENILIADFSAEKHYVIVPKLLKDENPLGLETVLKENPDIRSMVFDSATTFAYLCQQYAAKEKGLKEEEPGQRGYSVKNNYIKRTIRNLLRVAANANVNCIVTAHEAPPMVDDKGVIQQISLAMGGSLTSDLSMLPSEIWHVSNYEKNKRIAVMPCRQRQPMGTRMFDTRGEPEFIWKFDPVTRKGDGLDVWFKQWQEKGGKIPLPK